MKTDATGSTRIAERYSSALFELADEVKALDIVAADLRSFASIVNASAGLRRMVRNPAITREEQGRTVAALSETAGLNRLTRNFLGLLARNRRLSALPAIIDRFLATLAARRRKVTAEVIAAEDLTPQQRDSLSDQLRIALGQEVSVDVRVDPSLLGGLVVRLGSRRVDASLTSKLHRLEMAMKGVR